MNRNALWLLWAGFIVYVIFLAPPLHLEATIKLLINILTLQWTQVNPVILSLFALVGIWLLIYSSLLFFDGRMQSIRFYPFAIASVASGVIGLIPYLALRESNQSFSGEKDKFLKFLDSRAFAYSLTITTVGLVAYAFLGNWDNFIDQFVTDKFIHGMSLALCLFYLLFPTSILDDDIARRNWNKEQMGQLYLFIALTPLFGPLAYLCLRPKIAVSQLVDEL
ncbi:hypothetical protein NIES4071_61220 [Calothrix sp. NIES-4071]|nr:hypothetical protein NIES4071_61220 [Calothrix sp. NIES-4071]BAZ60429.1 hypothetical protein NIES4105_61170 [Calothrix sp. NIES-4105]